MRKLFNLKNLEIMIVTGVIFLTIPQIAMAVPKALQNYPELNGVVKFVNFLINLIRFGGGSIAGLRVTVAGWKALTANKGLDMIKEDLKNGAWALFFILAGSSLADFLFNRAVSMLVN